ncbi:Uncharacterized protein dnm_034270 [Desulfonema magnum]|uniref:Uncharacterized protein n=1 Tax=Desulfonema magnum TaxID=45655 RepID=A0A975BKI3_9BACT|nr:Uncharacterized protein dnm_034270 [Desulfonema magnum]
MSFFVSLLIYCSFSFFFEYVSKYLHINFSGFSFIRSAEISFQHSG